MTMVTATLDRSMLRTLRTGAGVVPDRPALVEVTGTGALACLQGLLTNDLERPGPGTLVYGALLTPKGMIVVDVWVARLAERFVLLARPEGREALIALLKRQLPPRLAMVTDRSEELGALFVVGPGTEATLRRAGFEQLPHPGGLVEYESSPGPVLVGRPAAGASFGAVIITASGHVDRLVKQLASAGAVGGDSSLLEAARILAGWPGLGSEIGEKTLPQEVRYDEIGGVSYQKGCYVGQETVARLHFRGHTNRSLHGILWDGPTGELVDDQVLDSGGNVIGTFRSVLNLPDRRVGLAAVRREVAVDATLRAGGLPARLVPLPFDLDLLA